MTPRRGRQRVESGLPPIAGILLIVAAGGGFKQILVDTGIGTHAGRLGEGRPHLGAAAGLGRSRC